MSTSFRKLMADRRAQKRFFDEVRKHNEESQFIYDVEVSKRRAKERVQKQKSEERIQKFYIFCVSIPAWTISAMLCWVLWRLFL